MDDRLDDRFAEAVRGALLAEVRAAAPERREPARAPRPPRRRIELVLAGVVAAVAVVAIVVAGVFSAGLTRRADPAGPDRRQPAQPFRGDCTAVLPADAVGGFAGAAVRLRGGDPLDDDGGAALPVPLAGALACAWTAGADDGTGLSLVVASADLPGLPAEDRYCYGGDAGDGPQWSCRFEAVEGGTWFSGVLTAAPGGSERRTRASTDDLVAALTARAGSSGAALPVRSTQGWSRLACDAVGSEAGLPRLLASPGLTTDEGNGPAETPSAFTAAGRWSRQTHCLASDDGADAVSPVVDVRALPDAAWLEAAVARRLGGPSQSADAAHVFVERLSGAAVNGPDSIVLWAFDGPNALRLQGEHVSETRLRVAAAALLRTLDAAR